MIEVTPVTIEIPYKSLQPNLRVYVTISGMCLRESEVINYLASEIFGIVPTNTLEKHER